jgi:hypothetical protein
MDMVSIALGAAAVMGGVSESLSTLRSNEAQRKTLRPGYAWFFNPLDGDSESIPTQSSAPDPSGEDPIARLTSSDIWICVEQDVQIARGKPLSIRLQKLFGRETALPPRRGFAALCEQWNTNKPGTAWESSSFLISAEGPMRGYQTRSIASTDKLRFSKIGGSQAFGEALIRAVKRVSISVDGDTHKLGSKYHGGGLSKFLIEFNILTQR